MAETRCSYPVLLISLLAGLSSGSENISKYVCSGDSVQMFDRIQINSSQTIVSLYKNGDKERIIASWDFDSDTILQENMHFDKHKNIWIIMVHPSNEGKYILQNDTGNHTSSFEVHLSVLDAPAPTCKPKIKKVDNVLKAYLEVGAYCGKPPASVYWLEYLGVKYEGGKDLIELQSGREAGTYYACIEGPAVSCARSLDPSSNYCSAVRIETSSTHSGTDDSKAALLGVTVAILVLQTVVIADLLYKKWKKRKKSKCRDQVNFELVNRRS